MGSGESAAAGIPEPGRVAWAGRLERWAGRLHRARLQALVLGLLDAVEPLGPLGAQVLWMAQPALSLLMPRSEIDGLARILEAPGGVAWVRERLESPGEDRERGVSTPAETHDQ